MSNAASNNGLATTPHEEMLLIHVGLFAIAAAIGSAGVFMHKGAAWLVQQGMLVAAAADPLLVLPSSGGAGLDRPRIAVAAAVLVAFLAWCLSAVRRMRAHRGELG